MIEDVAYRDLRYEGPDLPSIRSFDEEGDTVLVAGTFSKSFSPGIRVGYGLLPPDLVEPLCQQKGNFDFGSPNFAQHLMHHVLAAGEHDRHVAHLRDVYRRKRDAMLAALQEHFGSTDGIHWIRPSGGLYVWSYSPPGDRHRPQRLAVSRGHGGGGPVCTGAILLSRRKRAPTKHDSPQLWRADAGADRGRNLGVGRGPGLGDEIAPVPTGEPWCPPPPPI